MKSFNRIFLYNLNYQFYNDNLKINLIRGFMYKNTLYIFLYILGIFFLNSSYSQVNNEEINQFKTKTKVRVDLLYGAGYLMWVCSNFGKNCSSSFVIGNGTEIDVNKGDIFYIGIAALPRVCDFYKVIKDNDFSVISYWGSVFNPYFSIYGDDVIHYIKRDYTYNIVSGCQALQGEINELQ